jgi:hypothetical protein
MNAREVGRRKKRGKVNENKLMKIKGKSKSKKSR